MIHDRRPKFNLFLACCCSLLLAACYPAISDAAPGDLLRSLPNPNLSPPNTDYFGYAIANLGSSFVVGTYNDDLGALNAGSVYQFDANTFNVIRKLPNPTPQSGAQFGKSLAAIGTNFAVATASDTSPDAVCYFDGTTGGLLRTIAPPAGKSFGGAHFDPVTLTEAQGRIIVQGFDNRMAFDPANGDMVLDIPRPGSDPYFGRSMAERGPEIIVGGLRDIYSYNGTTGDLLSTIPSPSNAQLRQMVVTPAGHIFAAYYDGNAYLFDGVSHQQLLTIADPVPDHTFCCNVAAVGNYLILGNKGYNGSEGIAHMFDGSTGSLVRTINNPSGGGAASSGEYFGETIVPFGNNIMIGVIQADLRTSRSRDAGAVYVFEGALVPEPSALLLAVLATLASTCRRRGVRCEAGRERHRSAVYR